VGKECSREKKKSKIPGQIAQKKKRMMKESDKVIFQINAMGGHDRDGDRTSLHARRGNHLGGTTVRSIMDERFPYRMGKKKGIDRSSHYPVQKREGQQRAWAHNGFKITSTEKIRTITWGGVKAEIPEGGKGRQKEAAVQKYRGGIGPKVDGGERERRHVFTRLKKNPKNEIKCVGTSCNVCSWGHG